MIELVRNGIMDIQRADPLPTSHTPTKIELIYAAIAKYQLEIEAASTLKLTINLKVGADRVDCKAIVEHYDKG